MLQAKSGYRYLDHDLRVFLAGTTRSSVSTNNVRRSSLRPTTAVYCRARLASQWRTNTNTSFHLIRQYHSDQYTFNLVQFDTRAKWPNMTALSSLPAAGLHMHFHPTLIDVNAIAWLSWSHTFKRSSKLSGIEAKTKSTYAKVEEQSIEPR